LINSSKACFSANNSQNSINSSYPSSIKALFQISIWLTNNPINQRIEVLVNTAWENTIPQLYMLCYEWDFKSIYKK
jgi:hypothetical protein